MFHPSWRSRTWQTGWLLVVIFSMVALLFTQRNLIPQGIAASESSAFQQCPVITVSPASLSVARFGQVFSTGITATGGLAPYSFRVTGTLPPGVSFSPATGVLSGTPTTAGRFNFTIQVTDRNSCTGFREYSLTVEGCATITVSPGTLPAGRVGQALNAQVTATGGVGPYRFFRITGTLPPRVTLSNGGSIAGTPTTAGSIFILTGGECLIPIALPQASSKPG